MAMKKKMEKKEKCLSRLLMCLIRKRQRNITYREPHQESGAYGLSLCRFYRELALIFSIMMKNPK